MIKRSVDSRLSQFLPAGQWPGSGRNRETESLPSRTHPAGSPSHVQKRGRPVPCQSSKKGRSVMSQACGEGGGQRSRRTFLGGPELPISEYSRCSASTPEGEGLLAKDPACTKARGDHGEQGTSGPRLTFP